MGVNWLRSNIVAACFPERFFILSVVYAVSMDRLGWW
jgi:hypothetical protein